MPPTGAGYAATDWTALTVGQMWGLVKDDLAANTDWDQALAWNRTFELVDYHRTRIRQYRDILTDRWPPEKSAAARLFAAKLDLLLESMAVTADAALANGPTLIQLTTGLSEARERLAPVYERWAANEARLRAAGPVPGSPPVPTPGLDPMPVPVGEQEGLHRRAVLIMTELGMHTMEARAAFQTPPSYAPPGSREPITVIPSAGTSGTLHSDSEIGTSDASESGASDETTAIGSNPSSHNFDQVSLATAAARNPSQFNIPDAIGPREQTSPIPPFTMIQPPLAQSNPWGNDIAPARRPLGVIGGTPESLPQQDPQARGPATNPVGGVLGQPRDESPPFESIAGGNGGTRRRDQGRDNRTWEPDLVWEIQVGVRPVLKPEPERKYDPGPFIGRNEG